MKKIWKKIKNYFMKSCKCTAEAKDVVIDKNCGDIILNEEDIVFISPTLPSKDQDVVVKECKEEKKDEPLKKTKRKYKKRVKPENKQ